MHVRCTQSAMFYIKTQRLRMPVILETDDEVVCYDNVDCMNHARYG